MDPFLVLGTAGHVDHGKTTLVRALTGMETDRLPEERRRGISIELGFAWRDLPDGRRVAIVDVPGHERFIRHMIGGAVGLDAVMLVISADEGVMPQTREHLSICNLLGISSGFVVITRVDLVEPEFLALVREDIASLVAGTFLANAPVIPFSALEPSPHTLAPILAAISTLSTASRHRDRPFVLPIDRVFSVRGHGTVVTGTSLAGVIAPGDEVVLSPSGRTARVRHLEMHGRPTTSGGPGRRLAVNLAQLAVDDVPRGARIVAAEALVEGLMWDAELTALAHLPMPLRDGDRALLFVGTSQLEVSIAFLDREALDPGETAPVQLRLSEPLAILPSERFVLRGFRDLGPLGDTLGGGIVHGPSPRRRPSRKGLETWPWAHSGQALAEAVVFEHGELGLERHRLPAHLPLDRAAIDALEAAPGLIFVGSRVVARRALPHLEDAIVRTLTEYHRAFPARLGLRPDELFSRTRPDGLREVFDAALALLAQRAVITDGVELRLTTHEPTESVPSLRQRVAAAFEAAHLAPPALDEIARLLKAPLKTLEEEVRALVADNLLVRVSKELIFHQGAIAAFRARVEAHLAQHETLDAQALKELAGVSRKYAIPLGEWLDRAKVTLRVGDLRRRRTVH
jgi:selenocysteine-specific elongation factor